MIFLVSKFAFEFQTCTATSRGDKVGGVERGRGGGGGGGGGSREVVGQYNFANPVDPERFKGAWFQP
jgi:hypothetical protein